MMKNRDFQDTLYHFYALFVALVTFWVYMKTLAPTVSFFDSGELISAAYTLGIAHPPGYPLYVLMGWFFSKLPAGNIAHRINLMSACFAALAAVMVYYITYTIIATRRQVGHSSPPDSPVHHSQQPDPDRMLHPVISMIAALSFAFSITHWQHAIIAEVYSLNAFLCGLIVLLLVKWRAHQQNRTTRASWLLYLTAFIFGLGFGNHQTISLLSPAACFIVLATTPRILLNMKKLLLIVLFLMLGLSIYALVPIRAAQNPPINWGKATTLRQFTWLVSREGYKNVPRGHALKTLWEELAGAETAAEREDASENPLPEGTGGLARIYRTAAHSLFLKQLMSCDPLREFGWFGVSLALSGLLYGLFAYRVTTVTLLVAVLSLVVITVVISDAPEENIFLVKEFHTPSYLVMAVWIGMGAIALARAILWVASASRKSQYVIVFVLAVYFLIPPGSLMLKNLKTVNRRQNYVAYDYADNVLSSLKPNAILFTWGDSGAFPLWYLQIVEKRRTDVTLIHVPHLSTRWFVESLPPDLFEAADPSERYGTDILAFIDDIVHAQITTRPIYFDFSSAHSLMLPYPLLLNGITYKIQRHGESVDETVWNRYQFRGILDNTRIARDPDIDRTSLIYGSARIELGNYYLELDDMEKAAQEFNMAVQLEPSLGKGIIQSLEFRNKLAGEQRAPVQAVPATPH